MKIDLLDLYKELNNHMRDFRNMLKIVEEYKPVGFRSFKNFRSKTGRYALSIQASKQHYCTPRETLEDYFKYTSFEMALIDASESEFISFTDIGYHDEDLEKEFEGQVYGYVDTDVLLRAYQYFIDYVEE